jgi:molecular chaperone DnaK (HSP70)
MSLINQNTAAAVQYGIDRKYNVTDPPHNLIIYNMGASSTEVCRV